MTTNLTIERLWREQRFVENSPEFIDMGPPNSLEEFHKRLMGDPDWKGEVYIYVMDRSAYLVFHSDDLDLLTWKDLPNILLLDAAYSRETFTQYLAQAKKNVDGRRGWFTPTLHPMTTDLYNDMLYFCPGRDE